MLISERQLEDLVVRLSDFPKIKDIGRGAFGALYSARDPRNGGLVAVKIMRNDLTDETELKMFLREVTILASVDHATLLGFRGWVPPGAGDSAPPAVLTELMANGSLQTLINAEVQRKAPSTWTPTRKFIALYGTAIGMMVLHSRRIIHRDLKPDNVLLNDDFEPKVADFGLSKLVETGATMMQTMRGGTAPYMAPEIYGEGDYAFPVDVYAFAMTVYTTVTLMLPFQGITSPFQIGKKVGSGERPPIPAFVGSAYRELICACWIQGPETRPTFEQIVVGMGSPDFMDPTIDRQAVLAYQKKVLPQAMHLSGSVASGPVVPPPASRSPLDQMREAADAGDGFIANQYGEKLRDGEGISQNLSLAAQYFQRAAHAGDVNGMINWGLANEMARGVPENMSEAARWYRAAMDHGNAHGAFCYADMLENGKGVPKDHAGAVRCYKYAADAGHDRAQAKYGLICEQGQLGVPKNFQEAVRYYKMSSDQGSPRGMFCYADMLEFGKGVPQNMAEAVRLYKLSAEKEYIPAIGYLGYLIYTGDGVPENRKAGLEIIATAAQAGDIASWIRLGQIFEQLGDNVKAVNCYKTAAEKGHSRGMLMWARALEKGSGCPKDEVHAAQLYQKLVAEYNNDQAMVFLGAMKIEGRGCPSDTEGGKALLRRAQQMGNAAASERLRQVR
jgi:TPR repeat protein